MPISIPVNSEDLDHFFARERWVHHVEKLTPQNLIDSVALPDPETDDALAQLSELCIVYMKTVKGMIEESPTGFLRLIAQVGAYVPHYSIHPRC
jgi:hypothetical protein